ncbi:MAG: tRNA uridine-5-carboxymethylaminomethyl(34) synthesis GTPase MnmE [Desulfobacteraceae bacterium 4572_130]|nr:MAG: tRNA uridine-5-carboxymethylaminomethyl(34) synthesis GTPase MnmE [Desulfobacteraceae bacterium 4572_130]
MKDTIAAIATPLGNGGIGIIRISGPNALSIISKLFGTTKKGPEDCSNFTSHQFMHGYIFNSVSCMIIDEVLMVYMSSPRSYTTEDVVEIQAHSGSLVMRTILDQVISKGARLAQPGEFTKRAFLNGRIDLTQAEAVADIINAKSIESLKIAASQNIGNLKILINKSRQQLISFLSLIETAIDFPEQTHELITAKQGLNLVKDVLQVCYNGIEQYDNAHFIKDGVKITICGPPNVGKSSLMNCLLKKEKSIVTSEPGTTRDVIEENLNINGIPFIISDTAGMHQTNDLVEKIGIEKAKKHIKDSDIIIYVKEVDSKIRKQELSNLIPFEKNIIIAINKIDLIKDIPSIGIPKIYQHIPFVKISALKNQGIDNLVKIIIKMSMKDFKNTSSVVPNLRHKTALKKAVKFFESAKNGLLTEIIEETLSIDIKNGLDCLGEITGNTIKIDILDNIFKNFCIGK